MEHHINTVKASISVVCAALTALWGWFGWLVLAWAGCMLLDYLTGSAAAIRAGKWSSRAAREGIWHKMGELMAVLVAVILDFTVGTVAAHMPALKLPVSCNLFFGGLVVVWYILTECGSVVENAAALGAPVPKWLTRALVCMQTGVDAGAEGGGNSRETDDQ